MGSLPPATTTAKFGLPVLCSIDLTWRAPVLAQFIPVLVEMVWTEARAESSNSARQSSMPQSVSTRSCRVARRKPAALIGAGEESRS